MSISLGEAVLDLAADGAGLIKDIDKAKPAALSALDKIGRVGGLLLAAGITAAAAAIVGITKMVWDAGNTLDAAYDKIQQKTGATGTQLEALKKDFNEVFSSVPASADDASNAISILNQRLGVTGPVLQSTSESLLEMTRMTGGDLLTNGELFTRMVGDWGLSLDDLPVYMDAAYVASQKTGTGVDSLMRLVVQFGAPMREFGFSFEQSLAMLGKWEKEGVNTELVMGSLRIAAGNFARQNIPLQQGLQETFSKIKNAKTESEALAIAMDVFGARAGPDMTAAIRENRFELGDLVPAIQNADGAIMDTAQSTMDWGERWTMFKNKMTVALGPAGLKLMDAVSAGLKAIEDVVNRPDVQAGLMAIVNGIVDLAQKGAAALPIVIDKFFEFVSFLRNNQPILIAILAAIGVAIAAFVYTTVIPAAIAAITALAPIILIMAAVAAVAYVVYRAWTENWGGIQQKVAAAIAFMQNAISVGMQAIQQIIQQVLAFLSPLFAAWTAATQGNWYAFGANLRIFWDSVWKLIINILKTAGTSIINALKSLATRAMAAFKAVNWSQVGMDLVRGIADGIAAGASWIMSALQSVIQAAIQAALGFFGIGGSTPTGSGTGIHGRASGGPIFGGQLTLVGENGPELFVPKMNGTIIPNDMLMGWGHKDLNSMSSINDSITINGNVTVIAKDQKTFRSLMEELSL